ncbi:MAG: hypothetical protein WEC84_00880 [Candidatus Andersenbacteria bacterium]
MNAQNAVQLVDTLALAIKSQMVHVAVDSKEFYALLSASESEANDGTHLKAYVMLPLGQCINLHDPLPNDSFEALEINTPAIHVTGLAEWRKQAHKQSRNSLDGHLERFATRLLLDDDEKQQLTLELMNMSRKAVRKNLGAVKVCPSVSVGPRFTSKLDHSIKLKVLLDASVINKAATDATAYPDPAGDPADDGDSGYKPGDFGFITGA